jgi:uncharacterized protein (TIGR02646 family)
MRYINIRRLEQGDWPPPKWLERVKKAKEELRNLPEGKTHSDIFKKYNDIWRDIKEDFKQLSYGKCWYCEVCTDGMPGDMDHHRPKGKVTENPDHPGYWWLAFDWHNFRFSCEKCNSQDTDPATKIVGGKQNYFPLVGGDESRRIWDECDYEDLLDEDPLLLDPTEPGDPQLLTFQSDGRPGPVTEDEASVDYQRAKRSIEVYHLSYSVSNRRRRNIYCEVRDLVKEYQKYLPMLKNDHANLAVRTAMKRVLIDLRKMIEPEAQYASAARVYLHMHSGTGPEWSWVNRLLLTSS